MFCPIPRHFYAGLRYQQSHVFPEINGKCCESVIGHSL